MPHYRDKFSGKQNKNKQIVTNKIRTVRLFLEEIKRMRILYDELIDVCR